jgi:hypothetical protein
MDYNSILESEMDYDFVLYIVYGPQKIYKVGHF